MQISMFRGKNKKSFENSLKFFKNENLRLQGLVYKNRQKQWSKLEQTGQFDRVTDIITYGLIYFWKN